MVRLRGVVLTAKNHFRPSFNITTVVPDSRHQSSQVPQAMEAMHPTGQGSNNQSRPRCMLPEAMDAPRLIREDLIFVGGFRPRTLPGSFFKSPEVLLAPRARAAAPFPVTTRCTRPRGDLLPHGERFCANTAPLLRHTPTVIVCRGVTGMELFAVLSVSQRLQGKSSYSRRRTDVNA